MQIKPYGDQALVVEFDNKIDVEINNQVIALYLSKLCKAKRNQMPHTSLSYFNYWFERSKTRSQIDLSRN